MEIIVCLLVLGICSLLAFLDGSLATIIRKADSIRLGATASAILTSAIILIPVIIYVLYEKSKGVPISSGMKFFIIAFTVFAVLMIRVAIRIDLNNKK